MNCKPTPVAMAVAVAMMALTVPAYGDDASTTTQKQDQTNPDAITVTGIRASKQKSLATKRHADVIEEVVSAEDIGKMPDKNIADAVERLPGVTIQSGASGTGGAFDEADRVGLRGSSPSLTLTSINGHAASSGDWYVLDQTGNLVGRSMSYSLLPSELVGRVEVKKDPEASDLEGGVAGAVDIQTRKPLDFKKNFGAEMSLGAVYSSLPGKTDPQFNALFNWKNEAGTVGLIAQPFYEKRDLRRDGVEELQYERIGQQFPNTGLLGAYPQLAGVYYPEVVSSALFTQKRTREGGIVDLQFKPSANATLDLNAFYSHMDATNTNVAYMLFVQRLLNYNPAGGGTILQPGFNVKNGTLTSASFAAGPTNVSWADSGGYEEEYYRKAYADSGFIDLDGKFNLTDNLVLKTQLGATRGHGVTQEQDMWAGDTYGTGGAYTLNGTGAPTNSVIGNAGAAANPPYAGGPFVGPQSPAGATQDWFWGSSPGSALDREDYAQADGEYTPNGGLFTAVKFGARFSKHEHDVKALNWHVNWANYPASGYWPDPLGSAQNYPGNFGSGLGSGFINNAYYWSPSQLQQQDNAYAVSGANNSVYYPIPYNVKENDTAAYVEGKMAGEMWSGNIGVRLVGTQEKTQFDSVFLNNSGYGTTDPTPHLDSAWAPAAGYYVVTTKHNYVDVLPSANFKFELAKDVTLRLSANRSMSRPDYGAIGSNPYGTGYNDQTLTGSGGNPNLKPIVSNNLDSSLEWYFSSRGLASISLFNMDLTSYVGYGTYVVNAQNATLTQQAQHANPAAPAIFSNYTITAPLNVTGYIRGVELAYQQPIGQNFGIDTNLTYATGQETDNHCEIGANVGTSSSPCDIIGNSRITYNLSGYYEDDKWNARLTWSYRSSYYTGFNSFGSPEYQDGVGTLAASLGYKINDNMSVHLDLLNLNDPISKFYSYNKDQPLGIYDNGRQYYLSLNLKY